jgi:hypothetical protein
MPQQDLESLIAWLNPRSNPLLVQLPMTEYQKLREGWRWPKIEEGAAASTIEGGHKSVGKR